MLYFSMDACFRAKNWYTVHNCRSGGMVYAYDSKSYGETHESSSLSSGTKFAKRPVAESRKLLCDVRESKGGTFPDASWGATGSVRTDLLDTSISFL